MKTSLYLIVLLYHNTPEPPPVVSRYRMNDERFHYPVTDILRITVSPQNPQPQLWA